MRRLLVIGTTVATAAAAVVVTAGIAAAATTWSIAAPTGTPVTAQVTLQDNGALTFAVQRNGATVLSPAAMGLESNVGNFTSGLTFGSRTDRVVTQAYTMVTGKQRTRNETYNEATLAFTGSNGAKINVVVRAGREGVAYRYVLPATGNITVSREASAWTVPASSPAWLNDMASDYQGQWRSTTAGAGTSDLAYPALFQVGDSYVSIAETDVDGRYGASTLHHSSGSGTYTTSLENTESTTGPLSTPWRIASVGDLATVTANRLVDDMAPPSKIADTSWIKPGNVGWSWLTDPSSTSDKNRQKQFVDFAAAHGWSAVLLDEGWQASWVPEVVQYAKAKNVGIIIWFDSSKLATNQLPQLQQVKDWGAVGVKIDYVFEHDQSTMKYFDTVLSQTANLKLMVNFHGTEMTRGMQRTWPHVMTSEGVYGAEQKRNNAAFNTILPFTRNTVSSMDYTPVTFSVGGRDTTNGHELATAVVFESGWQHLADNPESYNSRPEATAILDKLPAAWDETRLLGGSPGKEAYLARRLGPRWYLGGISALPAKTFTTGLGFLGAGQWFVETVRDGANGGFTRETKVVTAGDTLSVPVAAKGGFASVVCAYSPGTTTCGKPGTNPPPPPSTNLALNQPTKGSTPCAATETSAKAVNGSVSGGSSDKWCSGIAGTKTIEVDLGADKALKKVTVRHAGAGGESSAFNTKNFLVETSTGGGVWTTAATVTGNTASVTDHTLNTTARWVRLSVSDSVARIYELEVYG